MVHQLAHILAIICVVTAVRTDVRKISFELQKGAGSLAEVSMQEDANLLNRERKELAAVSFVTENQKHSVNDTRLGCRDIRLQCRASSHTVTIRRAMTVGQIAGNIGNGILFIGYLALQVLQAIAVQNARVDAFNGGGMSATNVMLVHQHGLFGPTTNVAPLTYSSKAAVCSSITVDASLPGKGATRIPVTKLLANKSINVDWPGADALAAAACQVLELDLDAMSPQTIEAYVHACSQHSQLCGNPGICFYSQNLNAKEFAGAKGTKCPASKIVDVQTEVVAGRGPFFRTSFGRPHGPTFEPADSRHAGGTTVASWHAAGGSASGLVVSVQDFQLGERCVMSLTSQQVHQKFSNLLSPRGVVVLTPNYQVHRVELRAGKEKGTLSGCSWGAAKACARGFEICGEAKTVKKCSKTFDTVFQNLCCPATKLGLMPDDSIIKVQDLRGPFIVKALTHVVKTEPARGVPFQTGDMILAVAGAGLKAGECVSRMATVPLMKNWMYGSTPITLWIGREV